MVEEGDIIEIDIENCKLDLIVTEDVLNERKKSLKILEKKNTGYLKRYAKMVSSASKGAIVDV